MADLATVLWLTLAAGAAIPLGGWLAHAEHFHNKHLHQDLVAGMAAFGGGGLVAAVVLVLVPEAMDKAGHGLLVVSFAAGGTAVIVLQTLLVRHGTHAGEVGALLLHFTPESLALGAAAAAREPAALLLALIVGVQNVPEAFSAYKELEQDHRRAHLLRWLTAAAFIGPVAGVAGFLWLGGAPRVQASIFMAAAGGILALVFDDVAPAAYRPRHIIPPLGMVLGFTLVLVGHAVLR